MTLIWLAYTRFCLRNRLFQTHRRIEKIKHAWETSANACAFCCLRYCEPTDTSASTLRLYFCLRFRVVFNPNAWCKCLSALFFFLMRMLFLQKLEFCDERVISKTTHKSNCTICRNCFLRIRVFFNTNVWCKCASAFFGFICACYFCIYVSFTTPGIFRNPRLLRFARFVVIFACVFVYFVTLTLSANAHRRLFLSLCAYFFGKYVSFADECVISKHTHTSDCTFLGYFWLRMRVFFQP